MEEKEKKKRGRKPKDKIEISEAKEPKPAKKKKVSKTSSLQSVSVKHSSGVTGLIDYSEISSPSLFTRIKRFFGF